jgi:hypothetical protein
MSAESCLSDEFRSALTGGLSAAHDVEGALPWAWLLTRTEEGKGHGRKERRTVLPSKSS